MEMVTLPSNTDRLVAVLERIELRLAVLAGVLMPPVRITQSGKNIKFEDAVLTGAERAFSELRHDARKEEEDDGSERYTE